MGPLRGTRVIELAGMGPGPFCGMVLADLGADVVRVDRYASERHLAREVPLNVLDRGKRSLSVDLKRPEGRELLLRMVEDAEVFVDPFRPGVAERLDIGPETCRSRNEGLVFARMTGWGQDGPYAQMAGHDINYIAVSGSLHAIGRAGGPPVPPLNLVGDFGGGGMLLAVGVLAGLLEARRSGHGRVVDAAMMEGAALLTAVFYGDERLGEWSEERGTNLLDSGAPFYDVYETADGHYMAVGAIEDRFYAELLHGLRLDDVPDLPDRDDRASWPRLRQRIAHVFRQRTREEWCAVFEGTDACVTPVLSFSETHLNAQVRHRGVFTEVDGVRQPAPAPRFGQFDLQPGPPPRVGEHSQELLGEQGLAQDEIQRLIADGVVAAPEEPATEGSG